MSDEALETVIFEDGHVCKGVLSLQRRRHSSISLRSVSFHMPGGIPNAETEGQRGTLRHLPP